jgi:hypothetical protein
MIKSNYKKMVLSLSLAFLFNCSDVNNLNNINIANNLKLSDKMFSYFNKIYSRIILF